MRRWMLLLLALLAACAAPPPPPTPTPTGPAPTIAAVLASTASLGRYERIDLTVDAKATYQNPFDARQVALSATFTAPSGRVWQVPGFWDARERWMVRFTPSEIGTWSYTATISDTNGLATSTTAQFDVIPSEHKGWLQVASWVDPGWSPRYLAYHDGTPFYGVGHCDAFTLGDSRSDANGDLNLLKRMQANGENLVVWWPHSTFTFFRDSVTTYDRVDLELIDSYIASAERLGIVLVYTIWDHNLLRGPEHLWGNGRWGNNGFRTITPQAADFFTDEESWQQQQNLYRYIIARWGYSPAIMWMPVSELDGTSGGANQDAWHARINAYFVAHDPYRHPTTTALSGDKDWPAGFQVTDIPQVHLYAAQNDPMAMGDSIAEWTGRLWQGYAKPNVVGEFGTTKRSLDLRMLHNGIWSGLVHGAAITPLRWSDRGAWGRMGDRQMEQMSHFSQFVEGIPFARLNLAPTAASSSDAAVQAQALQSDRFALVWVQDRQPTGQRSGVTVQLQGLQPGSYTITPYDTWQGQALAPITASVGAGQLAISVPTFTDDIALRIEPIP
ncbi:MAG: hypothetical protein OHK0050_40860 [Roseiflexaceae bacterium]